MAGLKPSDELVAASFAIASVLSVFGNYCAQVNDVKASPPDHSTRDDDRRAALVSTALVAGVSLIARSPMVFVLGAGTIIVESVVRAHANYSMPSKQS